MRKILVAVLCVCAGLGMTLLSSCGSESADDVAQDRIYTFFRFIYDAKDNTTTAEARFTFGNLTGTRLTLGTNSSITCNGQPLTQATELVTLPYYTAEFSGKVTSGEFIWTDNDGLSFTNTITIADSLDYPDGLTTIDRSSSFDLEWKGVAVNPSEDVRCIINSVNVFTQAINGSTVVTLPTSRLSNIAAGTANFDLNRVKNVQLAQKTDAGGFGEGVYKAGEKAITLQ